MPQPDLEWTVMVYMAADNNLTSNALLNLFQMSQVGSTDRVHIVAQLDPFGSFTPAQTIFAKVGGGLDEENVIGEPNTGSVADLIGFIRWVLKNGHKAKKYLLVLWGHAEGVSGNEDDESDNGNAVFPFGAVEIDSPGNGNLAPASALNPTATAATLSAAPESSVESPALSLLPDASSGDALTSRELKEALRAATKELGVDKIHLLGMDACMMSMIEIARQVDNHASLMVASEESIPDKSWPYGKVLKRLIQKPEMTPKELSQAIVDEYLAFYRVEDAGAVTLTAFDLSKTSNLVVAVRSLADALKSNLHLTRVRRAIIRARGSSQSFLISDYVDLFDLCQNFQITLDPARLKPVTQPASPDEIQACKSINEACQEVMKQITNAENPGESFVFHSGTEGGPRESKRLENSHGVSIYFPLILPLYRNLEFSRDTNWDSFVFDYMTSVFRPAEVSFATASSGTANMAAASGSIAPNATLGGKQK